MCKISEKLHLCTCGEIDIERVKHYWIFHRLVIGKNMMVIGEIVMPAFIEKKTELENWNLLTTLLNEGDVFDKPLNPAEGDLLELSFQQEQERGRITYGFKYVDGTWVKTEYDYFEWQARHEHEKVGKIKNAIKRKNE